MTNNVIQKAYVFDTIYHWSVCVLLFNNSGHFLIMLLWIFRSLVKTMWQLYALFIWKFHLIWVLPKYLSVENYKRYLVIVYVMLMADISKTYLWNTWPLPLNPFWWWSLLHCQLTQDHSKGEGSTRSPVSIQNMLNS